MALIMYGIKNCDTIKKARRWLEENHMTYQFHDYRADGLDKSHLETFIRLIGDWRPLLNTRGSTWRQLSDVQRNAVSDADSAMALLLAHPTLIKRPLLIRREHALLGFSSDSYQAFTAENN